MINISDVDCVFGELARPKFELSIESQCGSLLSNCLESLVAQHNRPM